MITTINEFRIYIKETNDNIENEDKLELFMLPDFLYHISPIENKNSILNKGIILKTGGTSHLYRTYTPRIYLACSLIAAYDLYLNFNAHNGKEYLIYKIDKNKLSGNIYEDSKFAHGIHIDKNIPKEAIIEVIDPNTLKYNEEDLDNLYNTTWFDYQNESYYHGTPDQSISGKKGIHVGTLLAATQALEARIGVPAEGTWDGNREYGKTLLAGKQRLKELSKERGYGVETGFNCGSDITEENYYPTQRTQRAKYSDGTEIPFDAKPKIFKVDIIGNMTNWPGQPHADNIANGLIKRQLNKGVAKSGYYYINDGEDSGSISAVVPNKSFLKIYESKHNYTDFLEELKNIEHSKNFIEWSNANTFQKRLTITKQDTIDGLCVDLASYMHFKYDVEVYTFGGKELMDAHYFMKYNNLYYDGINFNGVIKPSQLHWCQQFLDIMSADKINSCVIQVFDFEEDENLAKKFGFI